MSSRSFTNWYRCTCSIDIIDTRVCHAFKSAVTTGPGVPRRGARAKYTRLQMNFSSGSGQAGWPAGTSAAIYAATGAHRPGYRSDSHRRGHRHYSRRTHGCVGLCCLTCEGRVLTISSVHILSEISNHFLNFRTLCKDIDIYICGCTMVRVGHVCHLQPNNMFSERLSSDIGGENGFSCSLQYAK